MNDLKWEEKVSWEEGIQKTVDWYTAKDEHGVLIERWPSHLIAAATGLSSKQNSFNPNYDSVNPTTPWKSTCIGEATAEATRCDKEFNEATHCDYKTERPRRLLMPPVLECMAKASIGHTLSIQIIIYHNFISL